MLKGKKILLGITGSIAAYKTAELVRSFIKLEAEVRVVMTPSALSFVTPLTLSTLSKNPVEHAYIQDEETGEWTNHVELGKWADLMLIAPLSANTLSKLVSGECDNLLMAVYLSADCPVMVAPAMDLDMAEHWTTSENLQKLTDHGALVLPFGEGELASGYHGKGRMLEMESITAAVKDHFTPNGYWKDKRVIVTAGPTHEAIDPVRFIGNHSSGKMGYAIAEALIKKGAEVRLISGPSNQTPPKGLAFISVTSAQEMFEALESHFSKSDVLIMTAAVADYKPAHVAEQKLKKGKDAMERIDLEPTIDILATFGAKKKKQKLIGFALETNDELVNAKRKLENKKLDMLVLNSLNDKGAGFGTDTNKVSFIFPDQVKEGRLKSKKDVAEDILNEFEANYGNV